MSDLACALALCITGAFAVDGDTFKYQGQNYRLWGIDAPEWDEPGGTAAEATLAALIAGQTLSCDVMDIDRYGRPVVRCDLSGGGELGCSMVASGTARDWPKYSGGAYRGCKR